MMYLNLPLHPFRQSRTALLDSLKLLLQHVHEAWMPFEVHEHDFGSTICSINFVRIIFWKELTKGVHLVGCVSRTALNWRLHALTCVATQPLRVWAFRSARFVEPPAQAANSSAAKTRPLKPCSSPSRLPSFSDTPPHEAADFSVLRLLSSS